MAPRTISVSSGLERDVADVAGDSLVAADDLDDVDPVPVADLLGEHRAADQVGALGDLDLGQVARHLVLAGQAGLVEPVRQEAHHHQVVVDHAEDEQDAAEVEELEHAEGRHAVLDGERADQQVGRGADQGAGAAEDRRVGQRHQQARRADPVVLGEPRADRDEDRHRGRVVDERGDEAGQRQQEGRRPAARSPRVAGDPVADAAHQAALDQALAQDEHHQHGDDGGVAEPGDRLLRSHQVEQQQQAQGDQGRGVERQPLEHERRQRESDDAQQQGDIEGHGTTECSKVAAASPRRRRRGYNRRRCPTFCACGKDSRRRTT